MRQLRLPLREFSTADSQRFLEARLKRAPLREVFRGLWQSFPKSASDPRLTALATERARNARDDVWRRRLWWLIGEFRFYDQARPRLAVEAYTMALESTTPRPAGFDIACLAGRALCLARAGFHTQALEDHDRMHELLVHAVLPRQRGEFLFELAEREWSDHGLLHMAHDDYLLAWRSHERAGHRPGVAACAHQAGIILRYLDGDFDESLSRLLEARRLYESLSAAHEVAEVDDDLEILFDARKEPRRRLAAATRAYLGTPRTKNSSRLKHAFRLRARARALNDLGRLEERERTMLQAIWAVESDICPHTRALLGRHAARLRIQLLDWQLARPDFGAALRNMLLLLPHLSYGREKSGPFRTGREDGLRLTALGRAREVFTKTTLATSLEGTLAATDRAVARDARMASVDHPLLPYYVGRGLVRN